MRINMEIVRIEHEMSSSYAALTYALEVLPGPNQIVSIISNTSIFNLILSRLFE